MHNGDFVIPLLVIGGAVVKWLAQNKLKQGGGGATPPTAQPHPQTNRDEWKELMEALGQEPQKTAPVPPPIIPKHTKPPVPTAAKIPEPKRAPRPMSKFDEISTREKELEGMVTQQLGELKHLRARLESKGIEQNLPVKQPSPAARLRDRLLTKRTLRDAVVYSEILAPPVSMRM